MIYAIVVIYNKTLSDCDFLAHLGRHADADLIHRRFEVIVYDNSLERQQVPVHLQSVVRYVHDQSNGGVAKAYNHALSLTGNEDDWLLLLDQDSRLPPMYLCAMDDLIQRICADGSIAAIAPHVACGKKPISPCVVHVGGRLSAVKPEFTGIHPGEIAAINSGMAVRASFMKSLGGFNREFWLDYLDHWLCRKIHTTGKKIYVGTPLVDHDLSVSNYNQLSGQRAANILRAEALFYREYKPLHEQALYLLRLICRALKQFITVRDKRIGRDTLRSAGQFFAQR